MTQQHPSAQSSQSGISAIESVLSLIVVAALVLVFASISSGQGQDLKLASVASRMTEVRSAADRYIRDNFGALETAATAGPISVSVNTLMNASYLPDSYSNANEYSSRHYIYLRRRAPGALESIVVTAGGQAMNQFEGGRVALLLKGPGGFVPVGAPTAGGTKGGWTATLASFVPSGQPMPSGSPAAYSLIRKFDGPSGALMRDDTGNPADNRMSTNLDMGWNDILNVRNISLGNTTINQTTVQNINDLASVSCANGEVLTKSGATFMCIAPNGMPSGGTAAFTGSCPAGWSVMPGSEGRVFVGAGAGYNAGDTGGSDFVTLTVNQMPAHNHGNGVRDNAADDSQVYGLKSAPRGGSVQTTRSAQSLQGTTETIGGGQAFDNRQAYIAVNWCRKQ